MNLDDWTEYKKIENGSLAFTNMVYVPLVSPNSDLLCMDFQNPRIDFDNSFFFERELHYLTRFKKYEWSPEILDIDRGNKKIYFKWYGETCNNIVETGKSIEDSCPNWKEQLIKIVEDIDNENVYKMNVYTHCFYVDNKKNMRAMDFYACVDHDDYLIPLSIVKPIIGKVSIHRWNESIKEDIVNFKKFFYKGISEHIIWPENILRKWLNEKDSLQH
jgi:hypothetical protein